MRATKLALSIAVASAAFAVTASASANVAIIRTAASTAGPIAKQRFARESMIRANDVDITYECSRDGTLLSCDVAERVRVANTGTDPEDVIGSLYLTREDQTRAVEVTVDGTPVNVFLPKADLDALDVAAMAVATDVNSGETIEQLATRGRAPFTLTAAPGSSHEIVFRYRSQRMGWAEHGDDFAEWSATAVRARHIWLSSDPPDGDRHWQWSFESWQLRTMQGVPTARLHVAHPSPLELDAYPYVTTKRPLDGRELDEIDADLAGGARKRAEAESKGAIDHTTWQAMIQMTEHRGFVFRNGGVLVGMGGANASDGSGGFRAKLGYEFSGPSWMLYSLSAESNLKDRVSIVPVAEAATPHILVIFPGFGAGLGVPVQIAPTFRAGLRLHLDLHIVSLGFVTALDWYPPTSKEGGYTQATFLGQVGI
jgi:hypothetical protein